MTFHEQERNVLLNWLDTTVTIGPHQQTLYIKNVKGKKRQKIPRVEDGSRQTLLGKMDRQQEQLKQSEVLFEVSSC